MKRGFYVVRMPRNGAGSRLIVESVAMKDWHRADGWRDFIQAEHPNDDVFVIER
jgi:hypothetical protein